MGLFDMFLDEDKRIAKEQRTLTNRDKQPEDREASARWLADRESPKAVVALLTRFDMNLDNHLKDRAEKDFVYALCGSLGDDRLRRHAQRRARRGHRPRLPGTRARARKRSETPCS